MQINFERAIDGVQLLHAVALALAFGFALGTASTMQVAKQHSMQT